ncbi:NAD(P)/FAD-dependent oxidoreductase [Kordiimonas pumila]|uniref:NAD(P)/FAD-dependent oxidoreductase n=1 Tax=Kordiimonas pumila TaxID=2161677 RepID=A0ABV7D2P5_9PROT|nr:FAD-binding oxidoreductase [Kordiimonas pumila]
MRIRDRIHTDRLPPSYYTASCNDLAPFQRLEGTEKADVCIIGGGFTGVAAAVELAERGVDVILLEQNQIGWGASGRNGGQVLGGYGPELDEFDKYTAVYGQDNARTAWEMANETTDIIRDRVAKYKIKCDLEWGYFDAAMKSSEMKELEEKQHVLSKLGYKHEMQFVGKDQIHNVVGSERFIGGLVNMGWGQCHPLNLVRGEARAAQKLGAKIYEDARVSKLVYGDKVTVDTDQGKVIANKVILAGNAYLGQLVPKLDARILPCGSYVIATEPLDKALADKIMPKRYAVCDQRWALDYFRMSADDRLLFGGLATYTGIHPRDLVKAIRPLMLRVFPELKDTKIDYTWGGYIGIGLNRIPQVGKVDDNVYFAQAYSGHGVAATHLSARVIAEAIMGDTSRFDIIAHVKHPPFPGGRLLRKPAQAVGMAYYRMLDTLKR